MLLQLKKRSSCLSINSLAPPTQLSATSTSRAAILQCIRWGAWCPFQEQADWTGREIQLVLRGGSQPNPFRVLVCGSEGFTAASTSDSPQVCWWLKWRFRCSKDFTSDNHQKSWISNTYTINIWTFPSAAVFSHIIFFWNILPSRRPWGPRTWFHFGFRPTRGGRQAAQRHLWSQRKRVHTRVHLHRHHRVDIIIIITTKALDLIITTRRGMGAVCSQVLQEEGELII